MEIAFISRKDVIDFYLDKVLEGEPIPEPIQQMLKDFSCL